MASIARRPGGQYRARYRDRGGREHARHFRTRAEAQRWLDEVTADLVTGRYVDPRAGRVTFADFAEEVASRRVWTPATQAAARQAWASVPFAQLPMKDLRRRDLEQWVRDMAVGAPGRRALAASTIRTRVTYVRLVLSAAVRERVLAEDPSLGLVLPREQRAAASMTLPTPEDVRAALAHAPEGLRAFVAVCAFAGLRQGEAAGLRAADVDWVGGSLLVRRQVVGEGSRLVLAPPKVGSTRTVPIPPELVTELARHVTDVGSAVVQGEEQLFVDRRGRLLSRAAAGAAWRRIRTEAGIAPEVTLHDLRHFYASALIASGCDVVTVQRALGHAQASVTLNTYAHLWPSAEDRVRQAASSLAGEVLAR